MPKDRLGRNPLRKGGSPAATRTPAPAARTRVKEDRAGTPRTRIRARARRRIRDTGLAGFKRALRKLVLSVLEVLRRMLPRSAAS